ncbi:PAS domain S-box protein, partial [uncultured Muriicola sp.]|uniref:PAS domain S-box protein n=1 Tax=uncultured Muriicola sp. TaxID=1583102 RepID=UPI002629119F
MNNIRADIPVYQSIFESSIEAILIVDQDGFILKANPASCKLFGYITGELIGEKVEVCIPQKNRKVQKDKKSSYTRNTEPWQMVEHINLFGVKRNGSQFPLGMRLSPANIGDKQVEVVFVRDISEQEKHLRPFCETIANLPHLRSMTIERNIVRQELQNSPEFLGEHANDLEQEVAERTEVCKAILQKLIDTN